MKRRAVSWLAAATLVALHERRRSGRGQHVDVSAQQAVTLATQSDIVSAVDSDAETAPSDVDSFSGIAGFFPQPDRISRSKPEIK